MKFNIHKILGLALVCASFLGIFAGLPIASATEEIFVNDGSGILGVDMREAYGIGKGEAEKLGGYEVLTADGIVSLEDDLSAGGKPVPSPDADGTTVAAPIQTVKVGLKYAASAMAEAQLENNVGSGFEFGYYDGNRQFVKIAESGATAITMTPTRTGKEVTITQTDTTNVLYVHSANSAYNLAVRPVSNSAKGITWFQGYKYYGGFEYNRYDDKGLTVINVVGLEDYIKGVVCIEMSPSWPMEAIKAQAITARSFFAANVGGTFAKYGFDVTNTTSSQAYLGVHIATDTSNGAVDATAGEYMTYDGKIVAAYYSSSMGGGTESSENVFGGYVGYCRGVIDPYEESAASENPYSSWTYTFTGEELGKKFSLGTVVNIVPTFSETNNVIKLVLVDAAGRSTTLTNDQCRTKMGLPSIHYTIEKQGSSFVIKGGGWGHNVGMSQWGAYAMAKYHDFNYRQILRYYYTDIKISKGI